MDENIYFFEEDSDPVRRPDELTGIVSPDTTKMMSIKRGSATFYFHTQERYDKAAERFAREDLKLPKPQLRGEEKMEWIEACNITCGMCSQMYERNGKFRCADEDNRSSKGIDMPVLRKTKACRYFYERDDS